MNHQHVRVPYVPDAAALLHTLHLDDGTDEADDFRALLEDLAPLAAPQAVFLPSKVETTGDASSLMIGGVLFRGSLLHAQLKDATEVWPYIATCGREIYDRVERMEDPFERYWGEAILEDALRAAYRGFEEYFHHSVYPGRTAVMSPGSLREWPIEQQVPLFQLLGEASAQCGVTLTDSLLMLPNKSVSGIRFPSEHGYVSCRYCPREACPNRKAEYEPEASWAGM